MIAQIEDAWKILKLFNYFKLFGNIGKRVSFFQLEIEKRRYVFTLHKMSMTLKNDMRFFHNIFFHVASDSLKHPHVAKISSRKKIYAFAEIFIKN